MCGITGIIDTTGTVRADVIGRMCDTLIHRGPDDGGCWVSPDSAVGLGHRRLSILDLSPLGHQPMSDDQGRVQLVFNGEVYNFRSLRDELKSLGYRFRSDTDTEVIIYAYLAWGIEAVHRFEGMFAFALYDVRERRLYLVRDRLGIKPLFYAQAGTALVFGSEIRAVLASHRVSRELSPQAAWDFLGYGYVPTPDTIYTQIHKLPPASVLRVENGATELTQYWQPKFACLGDSPETAKRRVRELVDQAVEDYLVSDVPTGIYLSGGLDSTIVAGGAMEVFHRPGPGKRLGGTKFSSYSIGFDVEEHSELPYARAAAEAFGTEHHEQIVTRDMAHTSSQNVIALFDEPFAASSTIPMLSLAKFARQNVTVALSGEGGDEVFGGYSWYRWWQKFQQPGFWKTSFGQTVRRLVETLTGHPRRKWLLPSLPPVELYAQLMGLMAAEDRARVFSGDLLASMGQRDAAACFRRHWRDDLPAMARMQYVDLMTFLPDLNLTRADRTSMNVSLELRVPLLNHHLVEYSCGLADEVRNPGGELKGLFKQALWDRLPESIRHRKKKGFSAPVKQWFSREDLVRLARDLRAEHPGLLGTWLSGDLEKNVASFEGSRAYRVWVLLQWLRTNA